MKLLLESTPETAHANGLPVRLWKGQTERGAPVLAFITRLALPDDAHPDDVAQLERELAEPPTREQSPGESRIAAPRFCRTCNALGVERPATHVARDAGGFEWFECADHGPSDNPGGTERVAREPLDVWFDRAVAHVEQRIGRERRSLAAEPSWLIKDFWVLYSAARRLHEALMTAVHAEHEGSAPRGELVADHHQGLALQLTRLAPAFDYCETARRGEPPPASAADDDSGELVRRARERCGPAELLSVRHAVSSWLHYDELSLIGPGNLARMVLGVLDALAIVHGAEAEGAAVELDAYIAESEGEPGRLPPRAMTDADREALAALHVWLHHPGGDSDLIEATVAYHDQVEREQPGSCERLEATIGIEQRAERDEERRRVAPDERGLDLGALAAGGEVAFATCRVCGCTDLDCSGCIAKTGEPCHWVEPDLCSACIPGAVLERLDGPLLLTDAMRELYRIDLCYRAPETLNVHEKRIIAAVEAEKTGGAS